MRMEITVSKDQSQACIRYQKMIRHCQTTYVDVNDEDESDDDTTDTADNGSANNDEIPVDLAPGEDDLDNDFIEEQLGTISGNVSDRYRQ